MFPFRFVGWVLGKANESSGPAIQDEGCVAGADDETTNGRTTSGCDNARFSEAWLFRASVTPALCWHRLVLEDEQVSQKSNLHLL